MSFSPSKDLWESKTRDDRTTPNFLASSLINELPNLNSAQICIENQCQQNFSVIQDKCLEDHIGHDYMPLTKVISLLRSEIVKHNNRQPDNNPKDGQKMIETLSQCQQSCDFLIFQITQISNSIKDIRLIYDQACQSGGASLLYNKIINIDPSLNIEGSMSVESIEKNLSLVKQNIQLWNGSRVQFDSVESDRDFKFFIDNTAKVGRNLHRDLGHISNTLAVLDATINDYQNEEKYDSSPRKSEIQQSFYNGYQVEVTNQARPNSSGLDIGKNYNLTASQKSSGYGSQTTNQGLFSDNQLSFLLVPKNTLSKEQGGLEQLIDGVPENIAKLKITNLYPKEQILKNLSEAQSIQNVQFDIDNSVLEDLMKGDVPINPTDLMRDLLKSNPCRNIMTLTLNLDNWIKDDSSVSDIIVIQMGPELSKLNKLEVLDINLNSWSTEKNTISYYAADSFVKSVSQIKSLKQLSLGLRWWKSITNNDQKMNLKNLVKENLPMKAEILL